VAHSSKYSNAAWSSIEQEGLVGYVLACCEGICSMQVVRMVLLQCNHVAGTLASHVNDKQERKCGNESFYCL
jgi:hypothetical protein